VSPSFSVILRPSFSVILRSNATKNLTSNPEILPLHFVQGQDDKEGFQDDKEKKLRMTKRKR
jgi:hypothetical protein